MSRIKDVMEDIIDMRGLGYSDESIRIFLGIPVSMAEDVFQQADLFTDTYIDPDTVSDDDLVG